MADDETIYDIIERDRTVMKAEYSERIENNEEYINALGRATLVFNSLRGLIINVILLPFYRHIRETDPAAAQRLRDKKYSGQKKHGKPFVDCEQEDFVNIGSWLLEIALDEIAEEISLNPVHKGTGGMISSIRDMFDRRRQERNNIAHSFSFSYDGIKILVSKKPGQGYDEGKCITIEFLDIFTKRVTDLAYVINRQADFTNYL